MSEIPTNLEECFAELLKVLEQSEPDDRKAIRGGEDGSMSAYHHTTGRGIRNNWGLWSGDSALAKWFKSIGIFHPDDMSGIIMDSFQRFLHGKPIELDAQVKFYQDYWAKMKVQNGSAQS